ncbi:MAG: response regulator, partial [Anaerolineales bacterium]|nr:response regulator [Anaerolineales bacterium]
DMTMPVMSGEQLINALYTRDPAIKIICFSGHYQDEQQAIEIPGLEWLTKPVDGRKLAQRVNHLLKSTHESQ